ncbi:hypothetical protein FEK33_10155 [Nocardia asteroides NBRC 15531]|nr:hypothetical protein [Nocardia asteroides]TLF70519.1 hypothetical protein FEK33_10155 [Nocardia asteroides NBRC 15531]UGT50077.1 hypothetical protein LT345_05665 [Nocardia asteroides]
MSDQLRHSAEAMVYAVKMWRAGAEDLRAASAMVNKLELIQTSGGPVQGCLPLPDRSMRR